MAWGGGVAQRPVLRVNKPEKRGARSSVGRSAAKTFKCHVSFFGEYGGDGYFLKAKMSNAINFFNSFY
jgi:hypothetical protein